MPLLPGTFTDHIEFVSYRCTLYELKMSCHVPADYELTDFSDISDGEILTATQLIESHVQRSQYRPEFSGISEDEFVQESLKYDVVEGEPRGTKCYAFLFKRMWFITTGTCSSFYLRCVCTHTANSQHLFGAIRGCSSCSAGVSDSAIYLGRRYRRCCCHSCCCGNCHCRGKFSFQSFAKQNTSFFSCHRSLDYFFSPLEEFYIC